MRKAFTIIEIFVSVMIISVVILGIAKIQEQNISMAKYIGYRGANEFANTLFFPLSKDTEMKGEKTNAYDAIGKVIRIKSDDMKSLLKDIERNVTISDSTPLNEEELPVSLKVRALMIKGEYPSRYYVLNIGKSQSQDGDTASDSVR